jgi:hypothetical protein
MGWFIVEVLTPSLVVLMLLILFGMVFFITYGVIKSYREGDVYSEEYIIDLEKRLTVADETIKRLTNAYVEKLKKEGKD